MLRDRLATLINSSDAGLARQGKAELVEVLKKHGSVRRTAEATGIPERSLFRWIAKLGIEPPREPVEERYTFTDDELRAAARKGKSAAGTARELGVHRTTVERRAAAAGIDLEDGRALRPVRKGKPV